MNEIWHTRSSGDDIYAFVRRKTDDFIYDVVAGSDTFEAFNGANIANYDLTLADDGGNFYSVNFPAGISANVHRVSLFLRATGAPLLTDFELSQGEISWNGTSEEDVSSVSSNISVIISDIVLVQSTVDTIASDLVLVASDLISVGSDVDTVLDTVRIQLNELNLNEVNA